MFKLDSDMPFDIVTLEKASENDANEDILNLTNEIISKEKNDILQRLLLPKERLRDLHKKLKGYRYIDEMPHLKYGAYIRWINLTKPYKLNLSNGGIICDIYVDRGIHVRCKNNQNRFFQIKMSDNLIFQKLTEQ